MNQKVDLYSMTEEELIDFFSSIGEPKFRAKQVFPRLADGTALADMTNLSKALREKLAEMTLDTLPKIELKLTTCGNSAFTPSPNLVSKRVHNS